MRVEQWDFVGFLMTKLVSASKLRSNFATSIQNRLRVAVSLSAFDGNSVLFFGAGVSGPDRLDPGI